MFKMLLLVCATGVSPADCQIDTAIDVIQGPATASAAACAFQGQAQLADTALPIRPGETYLKVRCTREIAAARERTRPGKPPVEEAAASALYR
ncbi:hypothetical protein [Mycobacterium sp. KBS0706]|uniref:hypothetical protein n=1 Tax=Mycobacterium sp. KBS0706 TaxID=2578109 RepID=UPI00163DCCF7|nr:hypothetical protein [Mycobacterium sp. KBS0706]